MADGILSGPIELDPRRGPTVHPGVAATPDLLVRHRSGIEGRIEEWRPSEVVVRDAAGRAHRFRNEPGAFTVGARRVTLTAPPRPDGPTAFTPSGSVAVSRPGPRVALASRIWVEGVHDAELVEKVWGDDLRVEGIVVEPLGGIDDLVAEVRRFHPGPERRLGVLVDHLVPGSKEARIAAGVDHPHVLVTGHPFVDVWAAVRPRVAGLERWPDVPRGTPWKEGICHAVGAQEPAAFWWWLLARVGSYADLDASLVGSVERLIDFLTDPRREP